ncbi:MULTISPECIES: flavin reductase family protein [unclassified Halanaerobium]|uniref:flavin reductase family protein n=1 Tax=unclassified Halanaerobium TaxID=2641197 RepID=UPI000DF1EC70|nr:MULTISPECIES: flavin reductase family protein [unclassified Halanaerobium]RCW51484.1 flavin reductase (DIM6/NTAB) family NADH-FMN oxidoreductase RutF [Halanaerobium sp. MA284_MarDTE_T2]RCW89272.1 flavin reductase (DIM6/NTAB) family NADH-FMN oxidoreductase RutF [Halanaerobium sp. DL-01]
MEKAEFNQILNDYNIVLPGGVFLTTKYNGEVNTMTMGWGTAGFVWNQNIIMAPVRKSRHTHQLIENSDYFTISVPLNGQFKKELQFCGTRSGRDHDKIKELGLTLMEVEETKVPIINGNDLHFICKIKYHQDMIKENLDEDILEKKYPDEVMHTFYYGEVVAVYKE